MAVLSQQAAVDNASMTDAPNKSMLDELSRVIQRQHYPLEVMLTCARWYASYPPSLRQIGEMIAERSVTVDHATILRWALKIFPVLANVLCRRKRPVGSSWRVDETYISVAGQWKYLYRAVDRDGDTVDFLLTAKRDLAAARRRGDSWLGRSTFTTFPRRSPSTKAGRTPQRLTRSSPTPA